MTFTNFNYVPQAEIPPPQLVGFTVGGTLTIDFSTPGTANTYQWFKEGVSIGGATSTILTIPSATLTSAGNYTVEIANTLVPGLTLRSAVHQAVASPCGATTRTSGQLDMTFIPGIDVQTYVGGVAIQSTGKILLTLPNSSIGGTAVDGTVRLNSDGTLDGAFNIIPDYMVPLIQTDDKILGYAYDQVIRYNADGTDDASFNSNAPQSYSSSLYAMALQPDGKIVYSIESYMSSRELVRLNTDGTVDPSFNIQYILANVIKVQADGKILIASNGIVSRLNSDGTGDLSFSVGLENAATVNDLAIQPDGKILIAGNFTGVDGVPHFGIARVNADGSLDNTFSAIGFAELNTYDGPYKIELMSNGQIILAGHFESVNGASRKNLVRLNADGSIDCGFKPGTSTDQYISGMALQSDDQILITGYFTDYDGTTRFGIARVNNSSFNITVDNHPTNEMECHGNNAFFTATASGTTNIQYQWQYSADGIAAFADIINGGGYSSVNSITLVVNTTNGFGTGFYRCRINGDLAAQQYSGVAQLIVIFPPTPTANDITLCQGAPITITASGGTDGDYRWEDSDGNLITGAMNAVFTSDGTDYGPPYEVFLVENGCQGNHTTVNVNTLTPPSAPTLSDVSTCAGTTATLVAAGGTNGQYRWYANPTGNSLATTSTNDTFTTPALSTTNYYVAIHDGNCESTRTTATVTILASPAAPGITPVSVCSGETATLVASGGVNGQYRWYADPTGSTLATTLTNDSFTTTSLTTTASYYVAINDGTCESNRTAAVATVLSNPTSPVVTGASGCPGNPITLTISGATDGQYRWYVDPTGSTLATTSTNASFTTPSLTITTSYYAAINNGSCESTRTQVTATVLPCSDPPVISATSITVTVQGNSTIDILSLLSDPNNDLDLSTLSVSRQPTSGAIATIDGTSLTIDYAGVSFSGTDFLRIRVCDLNANCAEQELSIEVIGNVTVFNALSPGEDGKNDIFYLQHIDILESTKNNKVVILNRWGDVVWETENYDNNTRVFKGLNNNGNELPTGVYFYRVTFSSGEKQLEGFISLKQQ
jgi:uncharacterized delta-60 repeat protein/gliding motility-associated-like protein